MSNLFLVTSYCNFSVGQFSIERKKKRIEECLRFRTSNFAKSRGLWSADSDREREQSPIKHKTIHSLPLERYEIWRNEHLWSASTSRKTERIETRNSDIDQSFGFPSFRNEAQELERLQREARELARRKAEEDHAEEIKAHEGKIN